MMGGVGALVTCRSSPRQAGSASSAAVSGNRARAAGESGISRLSASPCKCSRAGSGVASNSARSRAKRAAGR
jgi:hypothetical protein